MFMFYTLPCFIGAGRYGAFVVRLYPDRPYIRVLLNTKYKPTTYLLYKQQLVWFRGATNLLSSPIVQIENMFNQFMFPRIVWCHHGRNGPTAKQPTSWQTDTYFICNRARVATAQASPGTVAFTCNSSAP